MSRHKTLILIAAILAAAASCRKAEPPVQSSGEQVTSPTDPSLIEGFFLINEGNMGSNKCTIDHFDARSGKYLRNLYPERNPTIVKELGDVGNDIQIYGDRLYAVVNCSNLIEVMDVHTALHIGSLTIPNCRYITFSGGKGYVSSYAGPVQIDPNARPGKIVEFDLETLKITREVTVGYQPEEMIVTGGRLWVANSGGYRFPDYDRTISVVNLESFTVERTIDVAINLHRMRLAGNGLVYVTSRGDYNAEGSDIFCVDPASFKVIDTLGIPASEIFIDGSRLYAISTEWNNAAQDNTISYALYDLEQGKLLSDNFITDGTETGIRLPYGIAVNPETKEIYVCDATNYVSPGYLWCYSPQGVLKWKVRTGDIPSRIAFSTEYFQ